MTTSPRSFTRMVSTLVLGCALLVLALPSVRGDQLEDWRDAAVPGFSLPSLDAVTINLADQRGNLVIVHFFATWCGPCRDELKSLERLAAAFAARPLRIVAVDVGEPGDRVRRFLEREKVAVRYPVLIDFDKQVMRAWGVETLPTSYVLDAALCPHWRISGAIEWDEAQILSKIETKVSELERMRLNSGQENCITTGGTP